MNKKEFDMSQLVNGLTGVQESESQTERRAQAVKRKKPMEHVCTLVSVEQMAKVRTIAEREGIALKDIFAVGLGMVCLFALWGRCKNHILRQFRKSYPTT